MEYAKELRIDHLDYGIHPGIIWILYEDYPQQNRLNFIIRLPDFFFQKIFVRGNHTVEALHRWRYEPVKIMLRAK